MKRQLTVRLTDELEEQVEALARKLHRKRSEVVRLAIERFVQEDLAGRDRPFDRVRDLIGSVTSAIPDLGSNHREHLKSRFERDA
ncbi:MAG: ribbon-helix-helix protein, CopG family [Syntrophobacteraceae bacterium]